MTFRRRKSSRPTTVLDHVLTWARNPISRGEILCLVIAYVAAFVGALLVLGVGE